MQMKHECDNVRVHFGQLVLDYMKFFSSKAKGTFINIYDIVLPA